MRLRVAILAVCMLLTGSLNTIATKLQDNVIVRYDDQGHPVRFKHPTFQTAAMFLGETLCLLPFLLRRWYKAATRATPLSQEEQASRDHQLRRSFWVFMLPAACDAAASTLLNLGLFYTYASVFQMLRGTLVIFAGMLTIVLLKRRLHSHHWLGMVLICAGAALVGASSVIYDRTNPKQRNPLHALLHQLLGAGGGGGKAGDSTASDPLLGNILVVLAQLLAATQFIVEEKYLVKYRAPVLMAVGMEGFWGVVLCCLALPAIQHLHGPDGRPLDSIAAAISEVRGNWTLQWTTAATVISIGFFNFFGVSVTKHLSGAARATIDACRTLFIWLFALRAGWEHFHMLQVVGFVVLLSGTSVYNEILRTCLPPAEPRRRRHHRSSHTGAGVDAEGALQADMQEPLLLGELEAADGQQRQQKRPGGAASAAGGTVRFAPDVPATRPIAAGRQGGGSHARYTMARSVTILPQALSPHSLASVPSDSFGGASFTFSVPRNLSTGSRLSAGYTSGSGVDLEGGEVEEEGAAAGYSESEVSESDTDRGDGGGGSSRDASAHGRSGSGWLSQAGPAGGGGGGGGPAPPQQEQ